MSEPTPGTAVAGAATAEPETGRPRRRRRRPSSGLRDLRNLTGADRVVITLMWLVPTILVIGLVWLPALASVALSFARWEGLGGIDTIEWIGVENYVNVFTNYPPFWPAIQNNALLLVFLFLVPTILGIFLAVLIDRELRGSRFYQTSYFLPVVLSLALVGFIWQLLYSKDQGLINAVFGTEVDWYGDPNVNFYAVLVAVGWKQTGYIMLLYLAGLKGVDPSLREAAKVDGATEWQTFFRVVFPVMRPINIIVLVIIVIDSLRLFDLVWVINKGRNGLELISALVTQNIIGEASRIGFGSAMATIMLVISTVFIVIYLRVIREDLK
jgi:multiple sugar transport system permease protein